MTERTDLVEICGGLKRIAELTITSEGMSESTRWEKCLTPRGVNCGARFCTNEKMYRDEA